MWLFGWLGCLSGGSWRLCEGGEEVGLEWNGVCTEVAGSGVFGLKWRVGVCGGEEGLLDVWQGARSWVRLLGVW